MLFTFTWNSRSLLIKVFWNLGFMFFWCFVPTPASVYQLNKAFLSFIFQMSLKNSSPVCDFFSSWMKKYCCHFSLFNWYKTYIFSSLFWVPFLHFEYDTFIVFLYKILTYGIYRYWFTEWWIEKHEIFLFLFSWGQLCMEEYATFMWKVSEFSFL